MVRECRFAFDDDRARNALPPADDFDDQDDRWLEAVSRPARSRRGPERRRPRRSERRNPQRPPDCRRTGD